MLSITKTHSGNFTQGQTNAAYTITVSNQAGAGATSGTATVTETPPSGLTLGSMSGTGWSCSGTTCNRSDSLAAGLSYPAITATVNVAANASSPQVNQVSVSGAGSAPASAMDSTTILANPPVLSVTKTHSGNFTQGQTNAAYTITVSNQAGAGATNGTATVTDTPPSGLTLASMSGAGWSCSGTTCSRTDSLAAGLSYPAITATVNVSASASSPQVNQVSVSGGGSAPASNADSTTILPSANPPVLSIAKTHSGNFTQGQTNAAYTIAVSNQAGAGATNGTATVTETPPSGLTLVSMSGTGWSCSGTTCSRSDSLAAGLSYPAITATVNVSAGVSSPQVNQVSVSGAGSAPASAMDSTTILANPPVLSITKTHSGNFTQGQTNAAYTITVSNQAGAGATNGTATVTETPPSGLTLASMSGTGWSCSGTTCTRSDSLAAGLSYPAITATVSVSASASSPQVNQVSVSGAGSTTASAMDSTTILSNPPVLSITKTHSGNFTQGQTNAAYTITVSNQAGAGATNGTATVTETPPSGLTLASMSGTGWSCSGTTCTRSDSLAAGLSYPAITAIVNVSASASSPQVNQASVSGAGSASASASDSTTIIVPTSSVTIQTNPSGLQFSVDGAAAQTAPQTLNLSQGSHIIAVVTPQAGPAGTQYVFTGWSDGGAPSHKITVGSGASTYAATFKTQYQLTISASPAAGGAVTPASGGFYDAATVVPIAATANSGYSFGGWSGNTANASVASTSVTMSSAQTVVANFSSLTGAANTNLTYYINLTIGAGGVTGDIVTDGKTGALGQADILDWNLLLNDGATTFRLLGPLSGSNSEVNDSGFDLSATATQLLFNFSGTSYVMFSPSPASSGKDYVCFATSAINCGGTAGEVVQATGQKQSTSLTGANVIAATAPAWMGPVNLTDNFSPPSALWINSTGNWTATGGDYYAQAPNSSPFALTNLPFDLTGYTLTVAVNSLGDSGILVRTNATNNQYVLLALGGEGYGQGLRGGNAGSSIYWADSSNPSATQNLVTGVFTPGNTYTITVTAVGNTFSAYINGSSTPVTTFTDAVAGPAGGVALYDNQPNTTTGSGFGTPTTYSTLSLQGTTVSVHPLFFTGEVNLGSGVYYLQFPNNNLFGYYNYVASSIFYHYDMGYEAFFPGSAADIYLYDFTTGHWLYTSSTLFPYLYDFTLKTWIYYFPDKNNPGHYTTNPRYFSNLTTGQVFTM